MPGPYADNVKVGALDWNKAFSDVRVRFDNPSQRDYVDLDFELTSDDQQIWDAAQITSEPGISFTPKDVFGIGKVPAPVLNVTPVGSKTGETEVLAGNGPGHFSTNTYMVRCDRLGKNRWIDLTLQVERPNSPLRGGMFLPRTAPKSITVKGTYTVAGRTYVRTANIPLASN